MATKPKKPLSKAARDARKPRPPEELVGALQDRVHATSGRLIGATPVAFALDKIQAVWAARARKERKP